MTATKTQLIGGAFQDSEGNLLVNGYLEFDLNQDESVSGVGNIASGITVRIQLDSDANAASSTSTPPASDQFIWANDVMLPVNSYYRVTGFTAAGQPAWGPNNQQITTGGVGGGTFDLGTWIPNVVFSWTPPLQPLNIEVNGTEFSSQTLLNFQDSASIAWTDEGNGVLEATGTGVTSIIAGTGISVDQATGDVTVSATGGSSGPIIYNASGDQPLSGDNHFVSDDGTLSGGGTATVGLGGHGYSDVNAYRVQVTYRGSSTPTLPITVANIDANSFTVKGDAGATFEWIACPKPIHNS